MNDQIEGLETSNEENRNDSKIEVKSKLLTAKQETLNLFLKSQQGDPHIFPLSLLNLFDVTLCPITLDISSSPILVMQIRKVRDDYLDNYLVSGFITVKPLIVRKSHFISLFLSFFFTITR